jgi:hypothetical protein
VPGLPGFCFVLLKEAVNCFWSPPSATSRGGASVWFSTAVVYIMIGFGLLAAAL